MAVTMDQVKTLREMTSCGVGDCKKALDETGGDIEKAVEWLRKKGISKGEAKAGRATAQGAIASYIHGGKIGVMVEVSCETDFVAKNDVFQSYLKDLCMHVAATVPTPTAVSKDEFPKDLVEKERAVLAEAEDVKAKPEKQRPKIVEGRVEKFIKERCLTEQPFVKDPSRTVGEVHKEMMGKIGENMIIRRFVRWTLGGA